MNYSITKNGKELTKSKYTIDEVNKTFSSKEDNLVLDFTGLSGWTFNTGSGCIFNTSWDCVLNTGHGCMFETGSDCTFNTDFACNFKTGSDCTFNTGHGCIFKTGYDCTFKTDDSSFIITEPGTYEIKKGKLIKK